MSTRSHLLGLLAGQNGDTDAAIDLIRRAIRISPGVAQFHANLGEFYRRSEQWELAVASLSRAIELKPDLAEAHTNLGFALKVWGRNEEAVKPSVEQSFSAPITPRPIRLWATC